ncbi:MAG: tRNA threonylcarbamoyladenosine dehydratase [Candidatus Accumulibacter sp.]|jgi:tRNA A37 threonylcarbamoyladenosine dehydratase|nr:tRNA threonylcarbamoyladenosine dehydratase [Accumulibacter sp.]
MKADVSRRFGGVGRVYGVDALARFQEARVCVVGIGGVGSWAAEALARSAVGKITLIDLDMVAESNVNRQIHALGEVFGCAKTTLMAERIRAIHPACEVEEIEDFVTPDNLDAFLGRGFDFVIDAIDQLTVKAAMIAWCKRHALPIVTTGGAGGRIDPARIGVADLAGTFQDPLLSKLRMLLRRDYAECGFPREAKQFGVPAVFSSEALRRPCTEDAASPAAPRAGLSCVGYGSSVCITASFGFFAAGEVLRHLASPDPMRAAEKSAVLQGVCVR